MAVTVFRGIGQVKAAVGSHLGFSEWITVGQERIDRFLEATGDAKGTGPAGAVPPYLTLAMSNFFLPQILDVRGVALGVNYGCNCVRFPAAVPVGAKLRAGAELTAVEDIPGGVQTTITISLEIEDEAQPVCVIESVSRFLN